MIGQDSVALPPEVNGATSSSSAAKAQEYTFRCKTSEAYMIKILLELLHNNIKTGCFELTQQRIHFCMTDANKRTLVHFELNAKDFNLYHLKPDVLKIGLNINHFYKMLKSIKKKDSVVLFIREDEPFELGIQIVPKDHQRLTTSCIRIQTIQNLEILLPGPYPQSTLVSASEFSKMCKDMLSISNIVRVTATPYNVSFHCNLGSVYSREVILGETDLDFTKETPVEVTFLDEFDTEQLSRILKMSGLASTLSISCVESLPMLVQCKIGTLGSLEVYMKSRNQVEEENVNAMHTMP